MSDPSVLDLLRAVARGERTRVAEIATAHPELVNEVLDELNLEVTALDIAIWADQYAIVRDLVLDHGARVSKRDEYFPAVETAAYHGNSEIRWFLEQFATLDERADARCADDDFDIGFEEQLCVDELLGREPREWPEYEDAVPALCGAFRLDGPEAMQELIEAGRDVDAVGQDSGSTALHNAAWIGPLELVVALLDAGASASIRDANGQTPLHWAVRCERDSIRREIVSRLVAAGADRSVRDEHGFDAYRLALSYPQPDVLDLLSDGPRDAREDATAAAFGAVAKRNEVALLERIDTVSSMSAVDEHDCTLLRRIAEYSPAALRRLLARTDLVFDLSEMHTTLFACCRIDGTIGEASALALLDYGVHACIDCQYLASWFSAAQRLGHKRVVAAAREWIDANLATDDPWQALRLLVTSRETADWGRALSEVVARLDVHPEPSRRALDSLPRARCIQACLERMIDDDVESPEIVRHALAAGDADTRRLALTLLERKTGLRAREQARPELERIAGRADDDIDAIRAGKLLRG